MIPAADDAAARPLLSVRDLTKRFRGLVAVDRLSFDVPRGSIVALIGPNGAGKTTCFNMIAGALAPSAGTVTFDGKDLTGERPHRACRAGIGRTFQIVKPFGGLTVLENAMVGAFTAPPGAEAAREAAGAVLRRVGLWDLRARPAASLTLPERKRLEVARALATGPRLLLLDEVMAGLRPTETDEMVAVFRDLRDRDGLTILLIEHVMRAVMALADHVVVLHHGQVIAAEPPGAVTRNPAVLGCYLGEEELATAVDAA